MSTQSWIRSIGNMLDDLGVDYAFEIGGRHMKVIVRRNGRIATVTCSISPSDHKALLNVRRDVRRALGLVRTSQTA